MTDGLPIRDDEDLAHVEIREVKNLEDVAVCVGLPKDATIARISKAIYYSTNCGAFLQELEPDDYEGIGPGIAIGSIVEGSDVGATTHKLHYPFNESDIWSALNQVEEEAAELWHIANCHEEDCEVGDCQGCKDDCGCELAEAASDHPDDHPGFDPSFML